LLVVFPIFDSQLDWRYKYDDLHELVGQTAAELGIESLDLLAAAFRGLDGRRLALVPFTDGHPSEIAHRLAAQAILHHLTEAGVLPGEPPPVRKRSPRPQHT
jgi:YD repeat-containing protein